MTLEMWTAFAFTAMILLATPGPTIILVVSQAATYGRRSVMPLVSGVMLGDFTAMTLSLMGLGALMAASATLFSVMKIIGGGYLTWLGVRLWRTDRERHGTSHSASGKTNKSLFRQAFIVTALNPKGIAFFVAFLPQFVNPESHPVPQLVIMGGTFLLIAGINTTIYAASAGRLRDTMQDAKVRGWFNRLGGGALIGAGLLTLAMRRAS